MQHAKAGTFLRHMNLLPAVNLYEMLRLIFPEFKTYYNFKKPCCVCLCLTSNQQLRTYGDGADPTDW